MAGVGDSANQLDRFSLFEMLGIVAALMVVNRRRVGYIHAAGVALLSPAGDLGRPQASCSFEGSQIDSKRRVRLRTGTEHAWICIDLHSGSFPQQDSLLGRKQVLLYE